MGRLHPFPQRSEALSTTPSTGEAVLPLAPAGGWGAGFPSWLSWAYEFEEAKGEEAGKGHLGFPGELSL